MPESLSIISYISSHRLHPRRYKRSFKRKDKIPLVSIILILLIIGCFGFYLYMNLQLVEMNLILREREEELTTLEDEIKELESKIGNSLSIRELEKKVQELKLTKADDVRYLKLKQSSPFSLEE